MCQKLMPCIQMRLARQCIFILVTGTVFIQGLVLVPLTVQRQNILAAQLQDSTVEFGAFATRSLSPDLDEARLVEQIQYLFHDVSLGGSLYHVATGKRVGQFGETPRLTWERAQLEHRLFQGDRHDIVLPLLQHQEQDYLLILRQDASAIQNAVVAFILQGLGIAVVTALVLTGGVWLLLKDKILCPVLELHYDLRRLSQAFSQGEMPLPPLTSALTSANLPENELAEMGVFLQQISTQISVLMQKHQAGEAALKALNEQLEMKVRERTQVLDEKNDFLKKTLVQLETDQELLIESEKNTALDQLVTSIAHELNTPLGAMQASAGNIIRDLQLSSTVLPRLWKSLNAENQLLFVELVQQAARNQRSLSTRDRRQYRKKLEEQLIHRGITNPREIADILLDLGIQDRYESYLRLLASAKYVDLRKLIQQIFHLHENSRVILTAVGRASTIVFALKSYVQGNLNEAAEMVELTESIEQALKLYPDQLRDGVTVICRYGRLPRVRCYPRAITQVWINLFHNVLQALEIDGEIIISARVDGDFAVVSFEGLRGEISPDRQDLTLEPLFTNPSIGAVNGLGSALGLSVCQQVIEQHGGDLEIVGQPGKTLFTVRLPLEPNLELA